MQQKVTKLLLHNKSKYLIYLIISTKKKIFSDVNECRKDHNCHWAAILGIVYQMNLHHDYWKRNIFKMIIAKKKNKNKL